ncbi:MAG: hypothetical protein Q8P81_01750 [Nanoarchaeota archaeon]|nr:hypothetical protein [Nanoarchaeota archaeon]
MILIINVCKHKLHFYEFVKPVGDILVKNNIKGFIRHYTCLTKKDLEKASKIIICGTALKDNDYLENIKKFSWLKDCKKPVLGICAGMQIIGIISGHKLIKNKKIGVFNNKYYLHSFSVEGFGDELLIKNFRGYLFHPEVLNKDLVLEFAKA